MQLCAKYPSDNEPLLLTWASRSANSKGEDFSWWDLAVAAIMTSDASTVNNLQLEVRGVLIFLLLEALKVLHSSSVNVTKKHWTYTLYTDLDFNVWWFWQKSGIHPSVCTFFCLSRANGLCKWSRPVVTVDAIIHLDLYTKRYIS